MPFLTFAVITTLGSALWCGVLLVVGYYFGREMVEVFARYTKEFLILILIGIGVWTSWILIKKNGKKNKED